MADQSAGLRPDVPVPDSAGTAVGVIHSEPQRPVEFAGQRLADVFSAAADWLADFEASRGAPPDVAAATVETCEDGAATYRLILMCADDDLTG